MTQWIKREETNQFFYDATTVGASQCRRNVDWNALYEQRILLPHVEEQQKIADFLFAYDDAISYAKQELEKKEGACCKDEQGHIVICGRTILL